MQAGSRVQLLVLYRASPHVHDSSCRQVQVRPLATQSPGVSVPDGLVLALGPSREASLQNAPPFYGRDRQLRRVALNTESLVFLHRSHRGDRAISHCRACPENDAAKRQRRKVALPPPLTSVRQKICGRCVRSFRRYREAIVFGPWEPECSARVNSFTSSRSRLLPRCITT
jgi:hypothetical protein